MLYQMFLKYLETHNCNKVFSKEYEMASMTCVSTWCIVEWDAQIYYLKNILFSNYW